MGTVVAVAAVALSLTACDNSSSPQPPAALNQTAVDSAQTGPSWYDITGSQLTDDTTASGATVYRAAPPEPSNELSIPTEIQPGSYVLQGRVALGQNGEPYGSVVESLNQPTIFVVPPEATMVYLTDGQMAAATPDQVAKLSSH